MNTVAVELAHDAVKIEVNKDKVMDYSYKAECTFPQVNDTFDIQVESLVRFAGAIGYEAIYNTSDSIVGFINPRARAVGQERVSVNNMIEKHNKLPGQALRRVQDGAKVSFPQLVGSIKGEDLLVALFAGYTRLVVKIKMVYSRKLGLVVQSNKVKFQTAADVEKYKHVIV